MLSDKEIHRIARREALRPTALLTYLGIAVVVNIPLAIVLAAQ